MKIWIGNVQNAIGPKIDIDGREMDILALVFGCTTRFQGIYLVVCHQKSRSGMNREISHLHKHLLVCLLYRKISLHSFSDGMCRIPAYDESLEVLNLHIDLVEHVFQSSPGKGIISAGRLKIESYLLL